MFEKLNNMLHLATTKHAGQYDKAGQPYILHCLKVMHYVKSTDEDLLCIALGHDLMEDTDVNYDYLIKNFNRRIADGIMCLTKIKDETFENYKLWVMSNRDSVIVKMADLRHNSDIRRLKGVTEKDIQRMVKYMNFYQELKEYREKEGF